MAVFTEAPVSPERKAGFKEGLGLREARLGEAVSVFPRIFAGLIPEGSTERGGGFVAASNRDFANR